MGRHASVVARSDETASPEARVEAELRRLASTDLTTLRRRWRVLVGGTAPDLPRWLLSRVLAYRIQADAFGDLDPGVARLLGALGRGEIDTIPLPELRPVKPGTLLVREWGGVLQRVMVLDKGFAWNGTTYDSLSQVAGAITGTNINGPRIFDLRDKSQR